MKIFCLWGLHCKVLLLVFTMSININISFTVVANLFYFKIFLLYLYTVTNYPEDAAPINLLVFYVSE